jgi:predicted small secreted protein
MKKTLALYLILALFLLTGCADTTAAQGGVVVRGGSPAAPSEIHLPANEDIVYVSQSGTKYHTADCPLFNESFIPVTLEQALQEGKEPCSRCH